MLKVLHANYNTIAYLNLSSFVVDFAQFNSKFNLSILTYIRFLHFEVFNTQHSAASALFNYCFYRNSETPRLNSMHIANVFGPDKIEEKQPDNCQYIEAILEFFFCSFSLYQQYFCVNSHNPFYNDLILSLIEFTK